MRKRGVSKHGSSSAPLASTGASFERRAAAPQDEVGGRVGLPHASLPWRAPAGSSLFSTADQMAVATVSSLPLASIRTQRSGSAAAMSRNELAEDLGERAAPPIRTGRQAPPAFARRRAGGRPPASRSRINVKIGSVRADRQALERSDEPGRQIPRRALISARRIGEPVGNDPGPARKRWQNGLVEMVDAGGGEQECLSGGAEVSRKAGKDRLAQRLRTGRAPWFARSDDGEPERGQALLESLGLNRLADALAALERDETTPGLPGHLARPTRGGFRFNSHPIRVRSPPPTLLANAASKAAADGSFQHGSARIGNERLWDRFGRMPDNLLQKIRKQLKLAARTIPPFRMASTAGPPFRRVSPGRGRACKIFFAEIPV